MKEPLQALDFVARALGEDLRPGDTGELRSRIRSGRIPWEAVVQLANNQLLAPALWVALNRQGLADDLPDDLCDYLAQLHQMSCERNQHLRAQLLEAVQQLNTAGIVPVLLKGSKHLVCAIYSDPGVRIMSDIDILVGREEIAPSVQALQQLGYRADADERGDYPAEHHQYAPLFRPGDYAKLEIHRSLMEMPFEAILPAQMARAGAEPLEVDGARMQALSPTHRILHNIIHSQLVDMNHVDGTIALRSLHEVATESAYSAGAVNWSTIRSRLAQHNRLRELRAYTYMASRLLGVDYPVNLRHTPGTRLYYQRCRMQLRWEWADRWSIRLGRFSPDKLQKRYGYGDNPLAIYRARLRQLREMAWRFMAD
jgi:Uncharacterised nucleotidyltransferase